jgi:oxygen-independent coproporphyrinogen-3 oxidase
LPGWESAIDQGRLPIWRGMALDTDDVLRSDVIQQLMCHGEIDIDAIEQRYDIEFASYFADSMEQLAALTSDGLVEFEPNRILATSRGRLLLRIIAMCFDRYLNPTTLANAGPRYSRVI